MQTALFPPLDLGRLPVLLGLSYVIGLEVSLREVKVLGGRRSVRNGLFEVDDRVLVLAGGQVDDASGIEKIGQRPLEVDRVVDVFESILPVAPSLRASSQARLLYEIPSRSPCSIARR